MRTHSTEYPAAGALRESDARGSAPPGRDDTAGFGLIEALIAFVILSVGLLAIAGITLAVAQQTRTASYETTQALAGQQVLEVTIDGGYSAVSAGTTDTTVNVEGRTLTVERTVTDVGSRVREVRVVIPAIGDHPPDTMRTRLYQARPLPTP